MKTNTTTEVNKAHMRFGQVEVFTFTRENKHAKLPVAKDTGQRQKQTVWAHERTPKTSLCYVWLVFTGEKYASNIARREKEQTHFFNKKQVREAVSLFHIIGPNGCVFSWFASLR